VDVDVAQPIARKAGCERSSVQFLAQQMAFHVKTFEDGFFFLTMDLSEF